MKRIMQILSGRKFHIFCFVVFTFVVSCGHCQQYRNVIQPSPNAATLKQFGDFPVDYSTGTLGISIPIHTITTRGFSIPLKVSFNARGRTGSLNYSPLGVGWALDAVDYITREIRGRPDDIANLRIDQSKSDLTYLGTDPNQYNNNLHDMYQKIVLSDPEITTYNGSNISYPIWDADRDIYSYKINESSGKFVLDKDGKATALTYTTLKFMDGPFNSVKYVMDDKGNQYTLGGVPSAVESTNSVQVGGMMVNPNTSLFLSQIITAENDTITYNYEVVHTDDITGPIKSRMTSNTIYRYIESSSLPSPTDDPNPYTSQNGVYETTTVDNTNSYSISCLKSIVCPTGRVELSYNNTNRLLDSILVYDKFNQVIKTIQFDYVGTPGCAQISNNNSTSLLDLKVKDGNKKTIELYQFDYYNSPLSFSGTNNDLAFVSNVDWWGYCNSMGKYPPPIPTDPHFTSGVNGSKDADEARKLNGMLKKITYPTGGSTEFSFENNKCYTINGSTSMYGPGLRIAQLRTTSGDGNVSIKKLLYGSGENGIGNLPYLPNSDDFRSKRVYSGYMCSWNSNSSSHYNVYTYTPYPTAALSKLYNMPVFYNQVTEYLSDSAGNSLGKTEYYYDTPSLTSITNQDNYLKYVAVKDWTQSKLLEKKVYKKNSVGYSILEDVMSTYADINYVYIPGVSFIRNQELWLYNDPSEGACPTIMVGNRTSTYDEEMFVKYNALNGIYGIYTIIDQPTESAISVKTREMFTKYTDNGGSAVTITNYEYGNLGNARPTKESVLNSDGRLNVSRYKYANDFAVAGNVYSNMISQRNLISNLIEQTDSVGNHLNKIARTNYFSPFSNMFVPQNFVQKSGDVGNLDTLYYFKRYNENGAILECQQTNGPNEVYLWGYNKQYPVAKVLGSDYATVNAIITQAQIDNATNVNNNDLNVRNLLNSLRTSLSNNLIVQVFTYTYKPLIGMTSATDPAGRTTYYEYDSFGRLSYIKDDQGKILKRVCYNYAGQLVDCGFPPVVYSNVVNSQTFTRNNCGSGYTGSNVTYTVAAGTYTSTISQADANQKALNDITANGQSYANANGTCTSTSTVTITLQTQTSVSNFTPVTVNFTRYGGPGAGSFTFPAANNGTTTISIPQDTYQLQCTIPMTTAFPITFNLNNVQVVSIPAGLTTATSNPITFSGGTSNTLQVVVNSRQ